MSLPRLSIIALLLLVATGCVHGPAKLTLERQANDICWRARDRAAGDWRLAATLCSKELGKMDSVESAWIDGSMVRVKFREYTDQYGIWIK